ADSPFIPTRATRTVALATGRPRASTTCPHAVHGRGTNVRTRTPPIARRSLPPSGVAYTATSQSACCPGAAPTGGSNVIVTSRAQSVNGSSTNVRSLRVHTQPARGDVATRSSLAGTNNGVATQIG